ncbi:uncharacterized protein FA14DRAFT_187109 [Meira miltonrushii]|uniref:Uncharacterized protein n=1 Tax=Meira miltonrushii TaxID=1280837 RepID=A0A316VH49_9BASI|nr:uncharacterized protein FA14DRAFT_187109 [Meira miltonrushii]PWN36969.1 hypothetical protein FA14DRAFT_187109 [Meira miltonrushii]
MFSLNYIIATTFILCCLLLRTAHTSPVPKPEAGFVGGNPKKGAMPPVHYPSSYSGSGNGRDKLPTQIAAKPSTPRASAPQPKKTGSGGGITGKITKLFSGGSGGGGKGRKPKK